MLNEEDRRTVSFTGSLCENHAAIDAGLVRQLLAIIDRLTAPLPAGVQEIEERHNQFAMCAFGDAPGEVLYDALNRAHQDRAALLSHIRQMPGRERTLSSADLIEIGLSNSAQNSVNKDGRFSGEKPQNDDETDPEVVARRWMNASFPGSPIFENRVRSLATRLQEFYALGKADAILGRSGT